MQTEPAFPTTPSSNNKNINEKNNHNTDIDIKEAIITVVMKDSVVQTTTIRKISDHENPNHVEKEKYEKEAEKGVEEDKDKTTMTNRPSSTTTVTTVSSTARSHCSSNGSVRQLSDHDCNCPSNNPHLDLLDWQCQIPPTVLDSMVQKTKARVAHLLNHSTVVRLNQKRLEGLPQYSHADIEVGELIAQGGFANVFEIKFIRRSTNSPTSTTTTSSSSDSDQQQKPQNEQEQEKPADKEEKPEPSQPEAKTLTDEKDTNATTVVTSSSNVTEVQPKQEQPQQQQPQQEYVMKSLNPKLAKDLRKVVVGARDLVLEGYLLGTLQHAHILPLRGWCSSGMESFYETGRADAFFLVYDRLKETLADRLDQWSREKKYCYVPNTDHPQHHSTSVASVTLSLFSRTMTMQSMTRTPNNINGSSNNGSSNNNHHQNPFRSSMTMADRGGSFGGNGANNRHTSATENSRVHALSMKFFLERIQIALQIASALEYLHDNRIVYRDLKPSNVGFDRQGVVKLFDFGLAVELPKVLTNNESDDENNNNNNDNNNNTDDSENNKCDSNDRTYGLSGNTGTSRYMASEVIRNLRYNCKADVFSFSILLWQMMSLTQPYDNYTSEEIKDLVAVHGERPPLPPTWPAVLKSLLQHGWADSMLDRPTMLQVCTILQDLYRTVVYEIGVDPTNPDNNSSSNNNDNHKQDSKNNNNAAKLSPSFAFNGKWIGRLFGRQ